MSNNKTMKSNFFVQFDRIIVNSMMMNSGIFVGTNLQYGWSSHNKTNGGLMGISGDENIIHHNAYVLHDNDKIDTPINDQDRFVTVS